MEGPGRLCVVPAGREVHAADLARFNTRFNQLESVVPC